MNFISRFLLRPIFFNVLSLELLLLLSWHLCCFVLFRCVFRSVYVCAWVYYYCEDFYCILKYTLWNKKNRRARYNVSFFKKKQKRSVLLCAVLLCFFVCVCVYCEGFYCILKYILLNKKNRTRYNVSKKAKKVRIMPLMFLQILNFQK